jgi:hypothetical protein
LSACSAKSQQTGRRMGSARSVRAYSRSLAESMSRKASACKLRRKLHDSRLRAKLWSTLSFTRAPQPARYLLRGRPNPRGIFYAGAPTRAVSFTRAPQPARYLCASAPTARFPSSLALLLVARELAWRWLSVLFFGAESTGEQRRFLHAMLLKPKRSRRSTGPRASFCLTERPHGNAERRISTLLDRPCTKGTGVQHWRRYTAVDKR